MMGDLHDTWNAEVDFFEPPQHAVNNRILMVGSETYKNYITTKSKKL